MEFFTRLIHDDMFLAVVSYLSIGMVFVLYFYFREKKWEADLEKYEIKPVVVREQAFPSFRPGTVSINTHSDKIVAIVGLNEEMQVIAGQTLDAKKVAMEGATILPFKPVRRQSSTRL